MRAEVRKLDQYLEEYKLLCDHRIESPKELLSFQEGLTARISALEEQRYALRLKLRRVKSPEEEAGLKEHCKRLQKSSRLCDGRGKPFCVSQSTFPKYRSFWMPSVKPKWNTTT